MLQKIWTAAMARRSSSPPRAPKQAARPERQKREARPEKIAAFSLGISAESRAAVWLLAHGYRILARQWKSPLGEIDIIAARRHLLIFVEVKARATLDEAAESVTERQKQRIAAAAEIWLAVNPVPAIRDIRFDAILVAPGRLPRHIPAAFETS
jgi:putative endonuclease